MYTFWGIDKREINGHVAELRLNLYNSEGWFLSEEDRRSVNTCYDLMIDENKFTRICVSSPNLEVYSHPWIYDISDDTIILRHHLGIKTEITIPYHSESLNDKVKIEVINEPDSLLKSQYLNMLKRKYRFESYN